AAADTRGWFSTTWTVDTQVYGTTTITVSGASAVASNIFNILSEVYRVTPTAGTVGTIVTIQGTGYDANDNITVSFGTNANIQQAAADTCGWFSTTFTVDTQPYGTTTIKAAGAGIATAENTFFINHVIVYMTPNRATVGSIISMRGTGYAANQNVQISFGMTDPIANTTTDDRGMFEITWTVDSQTMGSKTVTVSVGELVDTASLRILGAIILSPDYGSAGDIISIIGTGFDNNENIQIDFGDKSNIVSGKTGENGTFNISFILVSQPESRVKVTANGLVSSVSAEAYIRLLVINISPEFGYGLAGATMTISGRGFTSGDVITAGTILIGSRTTAHGQITIAPDGTFGSTTITIPNIPVGIHDITIPINGVVFNFRGMYEVKPHIDLGEYIAGPPEAGYKITFNATGFPSNGIIKGMEL
ncbi:MAG: IPT/TIG domain-containing protein, partial [Candidatus Desantisbacteria bacterium]